MSSANVTQIINALFKYQAQALPETETLAAVLVLLLYEGDVANQIVITQRANSLGTYAGHFSLPGGIKDAADADLQVTIVRELKEELNLSPTHYQFLGVLDDFYDRYQRLVRPFVALMEESDFLKACRISPEEIASLYFFSLHDCANIQAQPNLSSQSVRHPSYVFRDKDVFIWGLTATILVHFANVIFGERRPIGRHLFRPQH